MGGLRANRSPSATSFMETKEYTESVIVGNYDSTLPSFPRTKCEGIYVVFYLVSSRSCNFGCISADFQRSRSGPSCPKLDMFAQSLLDACESLSLTDLVDGMSLSEECGENTLDRSGLTDAAGMQWNRDKIPAEEMQKCSDEMICDDHVATWFGKREIWKSVKRGKRHRCGFKFPMELYATK